MIKSGDNCIRKYFSNINQSCYIDSLFVSLFHSKNTLIDNFVGNLKIKTINVAQTDIEQLAIIATSIQSQIENIYQQLSIHHTDDKKELCNNIRNHLQNHINIINSYNLGYKYDFTKGDINPIDLLMYLTDYVFINENNITSISCDYNDYNNNNFNFDNNQTGILHGFSDINFITIVNPTKLIIKENIPNFGGSLVLHSIIVNTGDHYVCYYKCNNNWYYYNDTNTRNKTRLIGNMTAVNNNISKQNKNEIILLYLRDITQQPAKLAQQQQVPLITNMDIDNNESIKQLKKLINNHFDGLQNLITF
jgi:hypothetical protein